MTRAAKVVVRAFQLWWGEIFMLTFFNLAWLALQLPVVTGPPATAAMYAVARRVAAGESLAPQHGWQALRDHFFPAWQWALANLLVLGVVTANFWAYQSVAGWGWTALRLAWGMIALAWLAANLFYWPFWLAQHDRRPRVALRNCLLLLARAPGLGLTLAGVCLALAVASALTTLPAITALMAWLALLGTLAVEAELSPAAAQPKAGVEVEAL